MIPRRRLPRAAAPGLLLLLGGACAAAAAGGAAPSGLLPGGWSPGTGQECMALEDKNTLPGVDGVADSVSLAEVLGPHLAPPGSWAVFAADWDSLGAPDTAYYVGGTLAPARATAVGEEVLSRLKAQRPLVRVFPGPAGEDSVAQRVGWGVLLRADAGSPARLRTGWQEGCAPALSNERAVARALTREVGASSGADALLRTGMVAQVELAVDTAGAVTEVRVASTSGAAAVDSALARALRVSRYHPLRVNRRPLAFRTVFPLSFGNESRRVAGGGREGWSFPSEGTTLTLPGQTRPGTFAGGTNLGGRTNTPGRSQ